MIAPVRWSGDHLLLLDQTRLPGEESSASTAAGRTWPRRSATLVVRGAPAIGVAAAFGVVLAARESAAATFDELLGDLDAAVEGPGGHATDRRQPLLGARAHAPDGGRRVAAARSPASASGCSPRPEAILEEDVAANRAMGEHGATLVPAARAHPHPLQRRRARHRRLRHRARRRSARRTPGASVALVWVDETRPVMQGSRLTAWECVRDGIPAPADRRRGRGVGDGARRGRPRRDRRRPHRGQRRHRQQDRHLRRGRPGPPSRRAVLRRGARLDHRPDARRPATAIPIEERDADGGAHGVGRSRRPRAESPVYNPAFDVTPAALITAIITERGVFRPPYDFDIGGSDRRSSPIPPTG